MAGNQCELARARYHGRLPDECFRSTVPEWLQYADDHVVSPSYALTDSNGFKWLKFSNYEQFLESIETYWQAIIEMGVQAPPLCLMVMSYTPIADAHRLHQHVNDPDLLPLPFGEVIGNGDAIGGVQEMQADDDAEDEENEADFAWDEREATVHLNELGIVVQFTVINYGLLWGKAERFCIYTFRSDAYDWLLAQLELCNNHLHQPTAAILANLRGNLQQTRRNLVFALFRNGEDPHDVILMFFPDLHHDVYPDCQHCNHQANIEDEALLNPPGLEAELIDMGLEQFDVETSVDQANVDLMSAEGSVEGYQCEYNAMRRFNAAVENLRQTILPILNELHVVSHRPSVLGVPPSPPPASGQ